jgi:hypothetical protein
MRRPSTSGTAAGGGGLFTPVVWDAGTTEGGSSGGALVSFESGDAVVRGGLLGGDALCTNLDGTDYFSQFGAMLPLVRQYISPNFVVAGLVVSVEFYNGNLNHFFMTINPAEIAGLDNGTIVGWERTGFRFLAYDAPGPGRSPVCRFYRKPQFGDSHFFTADPAECQAVAVNFATDWVFENPAIYYVQLPNTATGACPAGRSRSTVSNTAGDQPPAHDRADRRDRAVEHARLDPGRRTGTALSGDAAYRRN